ncbi:MAG: histidine kinase, partial [Bacteroidetes bacterium]|nr:histidine kinase [Bacteroidota bacterium]
RVFINIIRNGVQAMERGGVISVESGVEASRCVVRISDTGMGIHHETGSRVFEPNFSTKTDGMGLGLAISRRAIQDLGGTITYQSVPGKGTTFEISLPV